MGFKPIEDASGALFGEADVPTPTGTGIYATPGRRSNLVSRLTGGNFMLPGNPYGLADELSEELQGFLLDRLRTPAGETEQFANLEGVLRDNLSRQAGAARQRVSDAAVAGGYFDSGERLSMVGDVDRAEIEAYASGLRDILIQLENQRTDLVLPYISGAVQENAALQGLIMQGAGIEESSRQFNVGTTLDVATSELNRIRG